MPRTGYFQENRNFFLDFYSLFFSSLFPLCASLHSPELHKISVMTAGLSLSQAALKCLEFLEWSSKVTMARDNKYNREWGEERLRVGLGLSWAFEV